MKDRALVPAAGPERYAGRVHARMAIFTRAAQHPIASRLCNEEFDLKTLVIGAVCALLGSSLSSLSLDWGDDGPAAFFRSNNFVPVASKGGKQAPAYPAGLITASVTEYVGSGWVAEGLRIAKIESRFKCNAKNPSSGATGLGQLMFNSAEILEPGSGAHRADCVVGARLLAKHMARCLQSGATTDKLMERCHLAGWGSLGWKLQHRAERYVTRYQHMVKGVQVADAGGWLVRGTTSIFRN